MSLRSKLLAATLIAGAATAVLSSGALAYDGKWYAANPAAEEPFRDVLSQRARLTWIPFAVLLLLLAGFLIAYRTKPGK